MTPEEVARRAKILRNNPYPNVMYTPKGVPPYTAKGAALKPYTPPKIVNTQFPSTTLTKIAPVATQEVPLKPYQAPKILGTTYPSSTLLNQAPPISTSGLGDVIEQSPIKNTVMNPEVSATRLTLGKTPAVTPNPSMWAKAGRYWGALTTKGGGAKGATTAMLPGIASYAAGSYLTPNTPADPTKTPSSTAADIIGAIGGFLPGVGRMLIAAPAIAGYMAKKGFESGMSDTGLTQEEMARREKAYQETIAKQKARKTAPTPKQEGESLEDQIRRKLPNAGTPEDKTLLNQTPTMSKERQEELNKIANDEKMQALRDKEADYFGGYTLQERQQRALENYKREIRDAITTDIGMDGLSPEETMRRISLDNAKIARIKDMYAPEFAALNARQDYIQKSLGKEYNPEYINTEIGSKQAEAALHQAQAKGALESIPLTKDKLQTEISKMKKEIEIMPNKTENDRQKIELAKQAQVEKLLEVGAKALDPDTQRNAYEAAQALKHDMEYVTTTEPDKTSFFGSKIPGKTTGKWVPKGTALIKPPTPEELKEYYAMQNRKG